jgi:uncharacterized protein YndB with AHSA1/START domain
MSELSLKTEGDTHVLVTRRFAAPPEAVYRAHTDPQIIQNWLLGPEGWTMPVCINDAKPGGKFRYEWINGKGGGFHITGEYLKLQPYDRIVHVERMHLPDPTPDNHIETRFEADGAGTLMTLRMTLPDAKTRTAMVASGMEHGMEASYVRLEEILYRATPANVKAEPAEVLNDLQDSGHPHLTVDPRGLLCLEPSRDRLQGSHL